MLCRPGWPGTCCIVKTAGTEYVAKNGFELWIFLPESSQGWDSRFSSSHLTVTSTICISVGHKVLCHARLNHVTRNTHILGIFVGGGLPLNKSFMV